MHEGTSVRVRMVGQRRCNEEVVQLAEPIYS